MKSKRKTKKSKIKVKKKLKAKSRKLKKRKQKVRAKQPATSPQSEKPKVSKVWSKGQLKKFKDLLIKQRTKIANEVEHITNDTLKKSQRDASGDLSGYTLHMADMATDHYDREFSLGIASSEQSVIYEIDEALRRVEDGTYGTCFTCDKPIGKRRLRIVPYAKHCISCQQKEELIQKRT